MKITNKSQFHMQSRTHTNMTQLLLNTLPKRVKVLLTQFCFTKQQFHVFIAKQSNNSLVIRNQKQSSIQSKIYIKVNTRSSISLKLLCFKTVELLQLSKNFKKLVRVYWSSHQERRRKFRMILEVIQFITQVVGLIAVQRNEREAFV